MRIRMGGVIVIVVKKTGSFLQSVFMGTVLSMWNSSDDEDEEDETAELLRELEKIKKERAEQREREVRYRYDDS